MSQADVDLVRRWYDAGPSDYGMAFSNERFLAAARPGIEGFIAPDFVFIAGEDDFTGLAGEYRGVDGFFEFLRDWYSAWASYRLDVEEMVDVGDGHVLVLGHEVGTSLSAGVEMKGEFGTVYSIRDGRIHRIEAFQNHAKARRAAGLDA